MRRVAVILITITTLITLFGCNNNIEVEDHNLESPVANVSQENDDADLPSSDGIEEQNITKQADNEDMEIKQEEEIKETTKNEPTQTLNPFMINEELENKKIEQQTNNEMDNEKVDRLILGWDLVYYTKEYGGNNKHPFKDVYLHIHDTEDKKIKIGTSTGNSRGLYRDSDNLPDNTLLAYKFFNDDVEDVICITLEDEESLGIWHKTVGINLETPDFKLIQLVRIPQHNIIEIINTTSPIDAESLESEENIINKDKVYPITIIDGQKILGGSSNGNWIDQPTTEEFIKGDYQYKVYTIDRTIGTGIATMNGGDLKLDTTYINNNQHEKTYYSTEIGISGPWNPLPREPVILKDNIPDIYKTVAESIVHDNYGMETVPVTVREVIRVDIDGDGIKEAIVKASGGNDDGFFSLVYFRKMVNNTVENNILYYGDYVIEDGMIRGGIPNYFTPFVLDGNGDNIMDIFLEGQYHTLTWMDIYEVKGTKIYKVTRSNFYPSY